MKDNLKFKKVLAKIALKLKQNSVIFENIQII